MNRKTQKVKADVVLKDYWRNNEHFADFFNAVLFDGKQVIRPDELEEQDTEASSISEHKAYIETIEASRDILKVQKKSTAQGVELVLLGMEAQEHIHYAMPMRVMGYDYGAYRRQYSINAQKYRENKALQGDEYLSGMKKKTDSFRSLLLLFIMVKSHGTAQVLFGEYWTSRNRLRSMLMIIKCGLWKQGRTIWFCTI